nr:MAG TPA: hypothetical protein [Herelleviridae sp.]
MKTPRNKKPIYNRKKEEMIFHCVYSCKSIQLKTQP